MPSAIVLLSALSLTLQQPNTQNPVDWKVIDRVLGRSGNLQGET